MGKELEPLQKLDEAIQALKAAGYKFLEHSVEDRHITGTHNDYSERVIKLGCCKKLPAAEDGEVAEIRRLKGLSQPPDVSPMDRLLLPVR